MGYIPVFNCSLVKRTSVMGLRLTNQQAQRLFTVSIPSNSFTTQWSGYPHFQTTTTLPTSTTWHRFTWIFAGLACSKFSHKLHWKYFSWKNAKIFITIEASFHFYTLWVNPFWNLKDFCSFRFGFKASFHFLQFFSKKWLLKMLIHKIQFSYQISYDTNLGKR